MRALSPQLPLTLVLLAAVAGCGNPESRKAANDPGEAAAAAEGTTEAPTESASATAGEKTADEPAH